MEARATFHNSDFKLTLGRVLCPSSVSFTALGLFTESDIKIAMILECLGGVWGQEERWGPGLFVLGGWKGMLELVGWESWASRQGKGCQQDPRCWRGQGRRLSPLKAAGYRCGISAALPVAHTKIHVHGRECRISALDCTSLCRGITCTGFISCWAFMTPLRP